MSSGSLTVDYFGYAEVDRFCSDAALQWVARELSTKTTARKINLAIHNSSINLLSDSGLITGIPFSFQSPFSCNATSAVSLTSDDTRSLLYLTELSLASLKLLCHVFLLDTDRQALNLKENIELLKEGALNARQRTLQRQVTENMERQLTGLLENNNKDKGRMEKHRRSLSEERIPTAVIQALAEKSRRASEDQGIDTARRNVKMHRRRKSTPIKCREIYDVEYIGLMPSVGSQLPDIDRTIVEIQKSKERTCQDTGTNIKGLLHIGHSEIQLLHSDHVTMIRKWPIKLIKACSQGKDSSFIGWSCRQVLGDAAARECIHVFKAASPDMGVTILHSIHKMCLKAYNQFTKEPEDDLRNKGLCKSCPIVIFNNLCLKLLSLSPDEVVQELSSVIGSLSENEIVEVFQMFKTEEKDDSAKNSLLVGCLRTIFERRQGEHTHERKVPEQIRTRRSRAVTVANPFEATIIENPGPTLLPVSQQRPEPKPPADPQQKSPQKSSSVRIAIYESLNTSKNYENLSMISSQSLEEEHPVAENTDTSSDQFDVLSEIEKQHEEVWNSLFRRIEESSAPESSFRGDIEDAVYGGVPDSVRGGVWKLLSRLKQSKDPTPPHLMTYDEMCEGAAESAVNAIRLDIGRTFPTHPYFKGETGPGQTALGNVLKAYSMFDVEVSYCQGMNFVAGLLLVHLPEQEAFNLLLDLMYKCQLRDVYKPHMAGLKMRLYQLSRLLHDRLQLLHEHLSTHEVIPSLYAVPWIMTAFSTQLSFRLSARLMDFILLQGTDAIFKVILYVLDSSQEDILALNSFEKLMNYMKDTVLQQKIDPSFEYRVKEIFGVDLSVELRDLEIEYKVLHEDLENANKTQLLETKYNFLKIQNNCHAAQIAQLNRDLTRERAEKREIASEMEKMRLEGEREVERLREIVGRLEGDVEMLRNENLILRGEGMKILDDISDDDDLDSERVNGVLNGGSGSRDSVSSQDAISIANIESLISDQVREDAR